MSSTPEADAELEQAKMEFDLLALIRSDTGEIGFESTTDKGEPRLGFDKCPVCGHHQCFSFYPDTNSWVCYHLENGSKSGWTGGSAINYLEKVHGMSAADAVKLVRAETGHPLKKGQMVPDENYVRAGFEPSFEETEKGGIKHTMGNFKLALVRDAELEGRIRMNEIDSQTYAVLPLPWKHGGEGELSPWDENYTLKTIERVHKRHGFEIAVAKADSAIKLVAFDNSFDPVRERLALLPKWDGESHASSLLTDFLGAEKSEYVETVSRLMVYGIVERQFNPGAKFDYMPVLMGRQGLGKSTFCKRLALSDDLFTDQMQKLDGSAKDELHKMLGHTVVEVGELNGLRKTDTAETIKSFISSTHDYYRVPYGRTPKTYPRRCILVGTTNKQTFLEDETGNRRFLPVRCGAVEPKRNLENKEDLKEFTQAYAEAIACRERFGALPLVVPKELLASAREEQELARMEDPENEMLLEWLDGKKPGDLVCARMAASRALHYEGTDRQFKAKVRRCSALLDAMPDKVERMDKKQRITGYGNAVTAWRVLE